jgi:glutathione peroxidase-family protein
MFSKIDVNGPDAIPLFNFLKEGVDIEWNFEKFLCDSNGKNL